MFRLFFTPTWFNGFDIIIEAFSLIVALLIAAYAFRIYKQSGENKFSYFSFAFVLLAVGLAAKVLTSSVIYFTPARDAAAFVIGPLAGPDLSLSHLFYRAGYFVQMLFMLSGWLLLFFLSQRSRERLTKLYELSQIVLFIYLVTLISVVATFSYPIFYLTSSVILALSVLNFYSNYLRTKKQTSNQVMLAFCALLVANVLFSLVFVFEPFYVIGEIILLAGFLMLLNVYRKVVS